MLVVLGYLICIAGIFAPHKLAGLEVMFLLQYTVVVTVWLRPFLPLPLYCMKNLQFSVGYNSDYGQVTDSATPPQAELFNLDSSFFYYNFNFFGLTYLLALLALIVSKVVHRCI